MPREPNKIHASCSTNSNYGILLLLEFSLQLQEAFAAGKLRPGLNLELPASSKTVNNTVSVYSVCLYFCTLYSIDDELILILGSEDMKINEICRMP